MESASIWPVVVLASGRGSNLQALHQASLHSALPIRIVGVFSDKVDSGALQYAQQHGVAHQAFAAKSFATREQFDIALMQSIALVKPKLIICAGFMRIISELGIDLAPCPMINIHPSLLPLYPGLHTHARALADSQSEHGASVHIVNSVLDGGRVLSQAKVPVFAKDDASQLAERVLTREYPLLIETVRSIIAGRITFNNVSHAKVLCLNEDNSGLD
jgi:phosphoribosylglycinamide formyltransferase-1